MTWGDIALQPGHGPEAHTVMDHGADGAVDVRMTCGGCGAGWTRHERHEASTAGRWSPTADARVRGARSFYCLAGHESVR